MSQPSRFWDKIADKYARQPIADEAAYQKKLETTQSYFRPDWEVMEFGCGTGSTALAHAPHVHSILATDISIRMIEIAREKAWDAGVTNVTFEQASLEDVAVRGQTFDAVLGLSVLHLLEDRNAAIATVRGLLKPGGLFISSTACLGDSMAFFKYIGPIGRMLGFFPMVKVFTRKDLEQSHLDAGFTLEHVWRPDKGVAVFMIARRSA